MDGVLLKRKGTSIGIAANGEPLEHGFNMFVLDPILNAVTTSNQKDLNAVLNKNGTTTFGSRVKAGRKQAVECCQCEISYPPANCS